LLVGLRRYSCSLDMWSLGCMLASLVFGREPFFAGEDCHDQLLTIVSVLGTKDLRTYLDKYGLTLDANLENSLQRHSKMPWSQFAGRGNRHRVSPEAIDLIDRLLVYDHAERLHPKEAMQHPYFDRIRERLLDECRADAEPGVCEVAPGGKA